MGKKHQKTNYEEKNWHSNAFFNSFYDERVRETNKNWSFANAHKNMRTRIEINEYQMRHSDEYSFFFSYIHLNMLSSTTKFTFFYEFDNVCMFIVITNWIWECYDQVKDLMCIINDLDVLLGVFYFFEIWCLCGHINFVINEPLRMHDFLERIILLGVEKAKYLA